MSELTREEKIKAARKCAADTIARGYMCGGCYWDGFCGVFDMWKAVRGTPSTDEVTLFAQEFTRVALTEWFDGYQVQAILREMDVSDQHAGTIALVLEHRLGKVDDDVST